MEEPEEKISTQSVQESVHLSLLQGIPKHERCNSNPHKRDSPDAQIVVGLTIASAIKLFGKKPNSDP